MVVRCTARLLKLLTTNELAELPPATNDWYANLIWIDRRKCLLVVHRDSLFAVFVADVRKPQLSDFGDYVAGAVTTAMAEEGLAADCLGPLDPAQVHVARTASRSILGVMNDMASMSRHIAEQGGGIVSLDVEGLNAFLRRTPYKREGYFRPIDAARQR